MDDNIKDKDLIYTLSEDSQHLIDKGLISSEILAVRDMVNSFDGSKLDRYNDSIVYLVYHAAKLRKTNSLHIIAKEINISKNLLQYYIDKYPKVGLAIQVGMSDARDEMKSSLVEALYNAAIGCEVSQITENTEELYDNEGNVINTKKKSQSVTTKTAPNVAAAVELMKRLDPSWVPRTNIDISGSIEENIKVVEDINVAIDYKKLSPEILKELITSQKNISSVDDKSRKLENGKSVASLKNGVRNNKYGSRPSVRAKNILKESEDKVNKVRKKIKKGGLI